MSKILLVEDDAEFSAEVADALQASGHTVDRAFDGAEALNYLKAFSYELLVFDWELPDQSGVELCRRIRESGNSTPILMLTGRSSIDDKETGLLTGADDYLTKPPNLRELRARVAALLRRGSKPVQDVIQIGGTRIDCTSRVVTSNGEPVKLLPREYALLEFLMRNPRRSFSSAELIAAVWPSESDVSDEVVRNTVNRIRKKVDRSGEPSLIKNVYGVGYNINSELIDNSAAPVS